MIYLPKRAVFIHIPRTAGNSITNAIASACAGNNYDIFIGTGAHSVEHWSHVARHSTASRLKKFITEWDDIFKFAIVRTEEDRLNSIKRLVQRDIERKVHELDICAEGWRRVLMSEDKQWYWDLMTEQDTDHYTKGLDGEDLGVELFDYNRLDELWPEICAKCQLPTIPLPHLNKVEK